MYTLDKDTPCPVTRASAPTSTQPAEGWSRVVVRLRTGVWDLRSSEVNRATLRPSSAGSPLGGVAVSPVLLQPRALSLAGPPRATSQQRVSVAPIMPLSKIRKCPQLACMLFKPSVLILHFLFICFLPEEGTPVSQPDLVPKIQTHSSMWVSKIGVVFSSESGFPPHSPDFSPPDLRASPVSADGDLRFLSPTGFPNSTCKAKSYQVRELLLSQHPFRLPHFCQQALSLTRVTITPHPISQLLRDVLTHVAADLIFPEGTSDEMSFLFRNKGYFLFSGLHCLLN